MYIAATFLLLIGALQAAEEPIAVRLATEMQLAPIAIAPIEGSGPNLKALQEVLVRDWSCNGLSTIVPLPRAQPYDEPIDFAALKGVSYLLLLKATPSTLACKAIATGSHNCTLIDNIPLTGDMSRDRVAIHALSDALCKALLGQQGIASMRILYTNQNDLCEADYDGANGRKRVSEGALLVTPACQASTICYVSYKIGQPKLMVIPPHGTPRRLTTLRGCQLTPALSLDGRWVAFSSDASGSTDLFVQAYDPAEGAIGKPRQVYTAKGAAQASPSFSPAGNKLAFVSSKDGAPKVYLLDIPVEGTPLADIKPTLLSTGVREATAPSWSPDGRYIAYSARSSGPRQIWVYDLVTKMTRQLTDGAGDKESPCFAPNSLHLLYQAASGNSSDLYLTNLAQQTPIKLTSGRFPVWLAK